jgi:hypothetical protein
MAPRFASAAVEVERRPDGASVLRSPHPAADPEVIAIGWCPTR